MPTLGWAMSPTEPSHPHSHLRPVASWAAGASRVASTTHLPSSLTPKLCSWEKDLGDPPPPEHGKGPSLPVSPSWGVLSETGGLPRRGSLAGMVGSVGSLEVGGVGGGQWGLGGGSLGREWPRDLCVSQVRRTAGVCRIVGKLGIQILRQSSIPPLSFLGQVSSFFCFGLFF